MQVVDINRGAIMSIGGSFKSCRNPNGRASFSKTVSAGGPYFAADSCT